MSHSPSPDLHVADVDLATDWDELIESYWEAWKHPRQAVGELTFAHLGSNTAAEAQALADVKRTLLRAAQDDREGTRWVKCIHVPSGRIVGGAMFQVHRRNPYRAGLPPLQATWFPEGSELRGLSEAMYAQLWAWRPRLMSDAHICMYGPILILSLSGLRR
ncbi:hypothetical protein VTN96DRAFT_6073 [Rasamsonia emersonii]